MERLTRKAREGFTLAELLIVVAIIAVLVAISIPIFSSQLERSRENTDLANLRAAKAAAVTQFLGGTDLSGNAITADFTCEYNTSQGKLVASGSGNACGKGTTVDGGTGTNTFQMNTTGTATYYTPTTSYAGQKIQVTITTAGDVTLAFID